MLDGIQINEYEEDNDDPSMPMPGSGDKDFNMSEHEEDFVDCSEYDGFVMSLWRSASEEPQVHLQHAVYGLTAEVGELNGKFQKLCRGDYDSLDTEDVIKELGDVLYYVTALANLLDSSLSDVMGVNVGKLADRMARDEIHGEGDDR